MQFQITPKIYDLPLAENLMARLVYMDFLTLADRKGKIEIDAEEISKITNVPLKCLARAIKFLESPDPRNKSKKADGARLQRIPTGWKIINVM